MNDFKLPSSFSLMCDLRSYSDGDVSSQTLRWLKNSAKYECNIFLRNSIGQARGYIAWADVSKETARRLRASGIFPQYDYEWREGNILLILDVAFDPSIRADAKKVLRKLIRSRPLALCVYKNRVRTVSTNRRSIGTAIAI